jgi:hypothetical protein
MRSIRQSAAMMFAASQIGYEPGYSEREPRKRKPSGKDRSKEKAARKQRKKAKR